MKKTVALLLFAASFWITTRLNADDDVGRDCYTAWFAEKPQWVTSALARQEQPPLILVDPLQNRLLAYSQNGNSFPLRLPKMADKLGFLPTAIGQASGGNLLLELADGTIVQFDNDFSTAKVVLAPQTKRANRLRLGSLYQWKLAGNYLLAYGGLLDERDNIQLGFFRVPLGSKEQTPEMLTALPDGDFYLMGNSYITTIGATAYYVVMGRQAAIFKVSPGHRPESLASFPEKFRNNPTFKVKMTGPRSAALRFAELETFAVASGLYSQDGFLYLLTRSPGRSGTEWYLYKLDPLKDRLASGVKLPTLASHLTVATSQAKWFFIQKGKVDPMQRQEIDNMIVIDNSAIGSSKKLPAACPTDKESLKRERLATNLSVRDLSVVLLILTIGMTIVVMMARKSGFVRGRRRRERSTSHQSRR